MRLDDLDELYSWMLEKRVLHVSAEGMTLSLDPSALPVVLMQPPPDAKEPGWDDDLEQETPQERIRREFAEGKDPDAAGDDA